jgi:glycosyltransferase involved in cell wall biosynthesis
VVQALLSGVATAAYDVDGTREVCITGKTGRLIPPGDRAALREALIWLRDHRHERRAMGETGRELCRHRFDADVMVDHLDAIYADVLGNQWIAPQRA